MKPQWWWLPVALVALLGLGLLGRSQASRILEEERARGAEAQRLEDQGLIVALTSERGALRDDVARLTAESTDLRDALARARAASPGTRPVATTRLRTGQVPAAGAPRPAVVCPSTPTPTPTPTPPREETPECLLADGDIGELRMESVELQTKAGNHVVVAALSAWRLEPEPATVLFHGPAEAPLSRASEERPADPRGLSMGLGLTGAVGPEGWLVGPLISAPPRDVIGLRWELLGGAAFGPSGDWVAHLSVMARR